MQIKQISKINYFVKVTFFKRNLNFCIAYHEKINLIIISWLKEIDDGLFSVEMAFFLKSSSKSSEKNLSVFKSYKWNIEYFKYFSPVDLLFFYSCSISFFSNGTLLLAFSGLSEIGIVISKIDFDTTNIIQYYPNLYERVFYDFYCY